MRIHDVRTQADLKKFYIENGLVSIEKQIRALKDIMGVEAVVGFHDNQAGLLSCLEQQLLETWDRKDRGLHGWETERAEAVRAAQEEEIGEKLKDVYVSCGSCGKPYPLASSFRCHVCGIWFCKACAADHFSEKPQERG